MIKFDLKLQNCEAFKALKRKCSIKSAAMSWPPETPDVSPVHSQLFLRMLKQGL